MRVFLMLIVVLLIGSGLGCSGEAAKGKNSAQDRPKPAERQGSGTKESN
jgi:hypothetical protein